MRLSSHRILEAVQEDCEIGDQRIPVTLNGQIWLRYPETAPNATPCPYQASTVATRSIAIPSSRESETHIFGSGPRLPDQPGKAVSTPASHVSPTLPSSYIRSPADHSLPHLAMFRLLLCWVLALTLSALGDLSGRTQFTVRKGKENVFADVMIIGSAQILSLNKNPVKQNFIPCRNFLVGTPVSSSQPGCRARLTCSYGPNQEGWRDCILKKQSRKISIANCDSVGVGATEECDKESDMMLSTGRTVDSVPSLPNSASFKTSIGDARQQVTVTYEQDLRGKKKASH